MTTLSGPMFEPSKTALWESSFKKEGAHYNIFSAVQDTEMEGLRQMFPEGKANDLNFCLFSTSGVHGTYSTIEAAEEMMARGNKHEDGEPGTPSVTFLIVHPRIVCLRYGNCDPKTAEDIAFLKTLRQSSWEAVQTIGKREDA